jgi:hypothetical protein
MALLRLIHQKNHRFFASSIQTEILLGATHGGSKEMRHAKMQNADPIPARFFMKASRWLSSDTAAETYIVAGCQTPEE